MYENIFLAFFRVHGSQGRYGNILSHHERFNKPRRPYAVHQGLRRDDNRAGDGVTTAGTIAISGHPTREAANRSIQHAEP